MEMIERTIPQQNVRHISVARHPDTERWPERKKEHSKVEYELPTPCYC